METVVALRAGDIQLSLLKLGKLPSIDAPLTASGATALGVACSVGNLKLVNVLLKNGADPSVEDADGVTCVAKACFEGHLNVVRRLCRDTRTDLKCSDKFGDTPVHRALAGGHLDIVLFLLDFNISPNLPTADKAAMVGGSMRKSLCEAPLHVVVRRLSVPKQMLLKPKRYEAMEMLLSYGADPTQANSAGDTPLHLCVRRGDLLGLWVLTAGLSDPAAALSVPNDAGTDVLGEADAWGLDASIAVRCAKVLPQAARRWVLSVAFSETLMICRAPTSARG